MVLLISYAAEQRGRPPRSYRMCDNTEILRPVESGLRISVFKRALEMEKAMKIGVSSYSFGSYGSDERLGLFGVIEKAAEMGFDGIEFAGIGVDASGPDALPRAKKVKEACAAVGLPIICYPIGADFLRAKGGWKAEVERLKGEVRVTAELGAPVMRHDATGGFPDDHKGAKDFAAALPILADACRTLAEYGATLGVKTSVENHGFFVQDSERCEQLAKAVDHENYGALIDIGNFLCADDDPVSATARMAPYAVHCHAKDFHVKPADAPNPGKGWFKSRGGAYLRGSIVGHGDVNVPGCIAALKAAGYDGWLSIEFEGMEDNLRAIEIGLENLRRYVAA